MWVSNDGHGCVRFGEFVRGEFIPDADLAAGGGLKGNLDTAAVAVPDDASALTGEEPAPPAAAQEIEMVKSMLFSSGEMIRDLETELGRKRKARGDLVLRALALDISVDVIAAEMGVGPSRVYQLRDRRVRERAEGGEFLPGLVVQVELSDRAASRYPVGVVVERPADRIDPDESGEWVWVRDRDNGSVYPVRRYRLRTDRPSCSACPPAEAPYGSNPGSAVGAQHGEARGAVMYPEYEGLLALAEEADGGDPPEQRRATCKACLRTAAKVVGVELPEILLTQARY